MFMNGPGIYTIFFYMVERSLDGIDSGPLKSPFRVRPGPFVELSTCFLYQHCYPLGVENKRGSGDEFPDESQD